MIHNIQLMPYCMMHYKPLKYFVSLHVCITGVGGKHDDLQPFISTIFNHHRKLKPNSKITVLVQHVQSL